MSERTEGATSLEDCSSPGDDLLSIGSAAAQAGVTERALRYYEELGLIQPSGHTPGGMRRYSQDDIARVTRIKEMQTLLALNLDEIASVLRTEDATSRLKAAFLAEEADAARQRFLLAESLALVTELRSLVERKQSALNDFMADLDRRISRITALLDSYSTE